MKRLIVLALTGLFLAFAGITGGAQAVPAGHAADAMRVMKDQTAGQVQEARHHRRWHRRHWRGHRRHCRMVRRCWRNDWGRRRCGWVRRCW